MRKKKSPVFLPEPQRKIFVDTPGGAHICCLEYGAGAETIVLLHGNGEDHCCFARQITDLAERFRVLVVESRGHGASPICQPMSLQAMAEDLAAVLETLEIERVNLVGFSDGANIAMLFAMAHPERIERLVLAGGNLFPGGVSRKVQRPIEWGWRCCRLLSTVSARARAKADLLGLMITQPQIDPAALGVISAPTLVLAGEHDLILPEHTQLIAASIPQAHLRIIPACDHFIFSKSPEWVNATLQRFMARKEE